jgi:hypothetical protein
MTGMGSEPDSVWSLKKFPHLEINFRHPPTIPLISVLDWFSRVLNFGSD